MAQTPNLKLNLFNGSDKPNFELFNDNNRKIDDILNNAKSHNHDGINSSKINASSVVFASGDTTLKANNLEDAVKEVFTEADSKIQWITDTIGLTSNGVSNPDIKVDELKDDFDRAKASYISNAKNYTLFNLNGATVNDNSSIKDITESINSTTFKDATATKDDILSEATAITKYGISETGTMISTDYLSIEPNTYSNRTVPKGMYKQLYLVPFSEPNPALAIKKGCNIMGVEGQLTEHGSGGWDIGDSIDKNKLTSFNSDATYIKWLGSGTGIFDSIKEPITITKNSRQYEVQHFRLKDGIIDCFDSNLKTYFSITLSRIDGTIDQAGEVRKNHITNKHAFRVFRQEGYLYAAISYKYRVYIFDLLSETMMYKYPMSGSAELPMLDEIGVPINCLEPRYNVCFFGKNACLAVKPIYSSVENAVTAWNGYFNKAFFSSAGSVSEGGINGRSINYYPKLTSTDEQTSTFPTNVRTCKMTVSSNEVTLTAGDRVSIVGTKGINALNVTYAIPYGSSTATFEFWNDDDSTIERVQTSSTATTLKTVRLSNSNELSIYCVSGTIKITSIKEEGSLDTTNMLFSSKWGHMGSSTLLGSVYINGRNDEVFILYGGHEKNLDEGKCDASFKLVRFSGIVNITSSMYPSKTLRVEDMFVGADVRLDTNKHWCLSHFNQHEGYVYGTFPDMRLINSTVTATGTRYHKYNRRLIKLNFGFSGYSGTISLAESSRSFGYRMFRTMYIDYKGNVMGLEQTNTLERFAYYCQLDSNLRSSKHYMDWSEDYYRTPEEDFNILDDGTALNRIRMLEGVTRLYNTDGVLSDTKIVGTLLSGTNDDVRSSQASMSSNITQSYGYQHGFLSIYNNAYRINASKE